MNFLLWKPRFPETSTYVPAAIQKAGLHVGFFQLNSAITKPRCEMNNGSALANRLELFLFSKFRPIDRSCPIFCRWMCPRHGQEPEAVELIIAMVGREGMLDRHAVFGVLENTSESFRTNRGLGSANACRGLPTAAGKPARHSSARRTGTSQRCRTSLQPLIFV